MIDIAVHIGKLVREHELVIIPGLGGFLTNFHASTLHAISNKIEPPGRHIAFNSQLKDNDGFLAHSLSNNSSLSYKESLNLVETFADFCQEELTNGGQISFENLGLLSLNKSGHIEFSADLTVNYDDQYFGLPEIIAMPIQRHKKHEAVITLHPEAKKKIKSQAPIIRKIAAVALPFLLLSTLIWFVKEPIRNYYQQSASLVTLSSDSAIEESKSPTTNQNLELNQAASETSPNVINKDQPIVIENSEIVLEEDIEIPNGPYHIITGAFGNKEFANQLLTKLEAEGFDCYIAGQNNSGLYRVSAANFSNHSKALEQLKWFQANKNNGAWLLKLDL